MGSEICPKNGCVRRRRANSHLIRILCRCTSLVPPSLTIHTICVSMNNEPDRTAVAAPIRTDVTGSAHPGYVPIHAVPGTSVNYTLSDMYGGACLVAGTSASARASLPPATGKKRMSGYMRITTHITCRCTTRTPSYGKTLCPDTCMRITTHIPCRCTTYRLTQSPS